MEKDVLALDKALGLAAVDRQTERGKDIDGRMHERM